MDDETLTLDELDDVIDALWLRGFSKDDIRQAVENRLANVDVELRDMREGDDGSNIVTP